MGWVERRTAAAHDWRQASSSDHAADQVSAPSLAASLAAGGRTRSIDPKRPPSVGWRLGHSLARSSAG